MGGATSSFKPRCQSDSSDDKTKTRLRVRAAHHGRSMEEERRIIMGRMSAG
jgi:plasmid stability protein